VTGDRAHLETREEWSEGGGHLGHHLVVAEVDAVTDAR